MDIREVTKEEKEKYILQVKDHFKYMRDVINQVEIDLESTDLIVQASSVWIAGNLCTWFDDFMRQIREIDKKQQSLNSIKNEIKEAVNGSINIDTSVH